jgi:hypothetical protein
LVAALSHRQAAMLLLLIRGNLSPPLPLPPRRRILGKNSPTINGSEKNWRLQGTAKRDFAQERRRLLALFFPWLKSDHTLGVERVKKLGEISRWKSYG